MALYHSIRDLIYLKSLIKEVVDNLEMDSEKMYFLYIYTIYEDKNSAIVVAKSPRMTPTSKQISVRYNWLRHYVGKEFTIKKIKSENYKSDIFTNVSLFPEFFQFHVSYNTTARPQLPEIVSHKTSLRSYNRNR